MHPKKNVQGSVLNGYFKFIKKKWGNDGVYECAEALGIHPDLIKEGKWYDKQLSVDVLGWIGNNKGIQNVEACGNYTVKDLGILSYIVRFKDITSILNRIPKSYSEAFDYGRVEVDIEKNRATIRMFETEPEEYSCIAWTGCFKGMMEMTKTQGTVTESQCQLKEDPHCEFLMEWDGKESKQF